MLKLTATARADVRHSIFDVPGDSVIAIWPEGDLWACSVYGLIFEGESAAEVLRELANVLEES